MALPGYNLALFQPLMGHNRGSAEQWKINEFAVRLEVLAEPMAFVYPLGGALSA